MENIQLLVLCVIFTGCSQWTYDLNIPVWQYKNYKTCEAKTIQTSLPFDLAVTTHRFDLPYRYDAINSMRPYIISQNGEYQDVGSDLIDVLGEENVQPASWSQDGNTLFIEKAWEDPQNAMLEAVIQDLNIQPGLYKGDVVSYDIKSRYYSNLTGVDRVSFYNYGGQSWNGSNIILFQAFINGISVPYVMNPDGTNKLPASSSKEFAYGFHVSPDGTKYAYHADYKVFVGDTQTHIETQVTTSCVFNFNPVWSPDSQTIAFLCGTDNLHADIWTADRNGTNASFLASRNGFSGIVPFMNGYDFHGGGSDIITWSYDSSSVFYAKGVNQSVELYIASGTQDTRLTFSPDGSLNNFPSLSPDGKTRAYTKFTGNKRDLFIMDLNSFTETQVTDVDGNCGIRYPMWRPVKVAN